MPLWLIIKVVMHAAPVVEVRKYNQIAQEREGTSLLGPKPMHKEGGFSGAINRLNVPLGGH